MLVALFVLTTPTRAYEANNISNLIIHHQNQLLNVTPVKTQVALVNKKSAVHADDICGQAALKAERDYQIKPELLQTIAMVESGRWNKKLHRRMAWPWTVQSNGHGQYYKTKEEAVAAVKALQAQGITNIDVGCMQINLKYHGQAFNSVEEALEPEKNVAYGARFLQKLYQKNGHNWQKTAMQYHSKNHTKGMNYKNRLERHYAAYINPAPQQSLFE